MPTVREIEQALFRLAPKEGAMDWDNVGQLLGDPEAEVRWVLVALDITEAVADEAIAENCQLIVSHHPVMNCKWLPVQTVRQDTPQGHLLLKILMPITSNLLFMCFAHPFFLNSHLNILTTYFPISFRIQGKQ